MTRDLKRVGSTEQRREKGSGDMRNYRERSKKAGKGKDSLWGGRCARLRFAGRAVSSVSAGLINVREEKTKPLRDL